jgi:hypothetical protein
MEFLRRQERGGGPATAVALVLDAVRTNNLHVERGVQLSGTPDDNADPSDITVCWPAIYMRSTMHLGSPAPSHRSERDGGSQSNLLATWRKTGGSSPRSSPNMLTAGSRKVPTMPANKSRLLEYDGVWPHCEWENLVALFSPDTLATDISAPGRRSLKLITDTDVPEDANHGVISFRVVNEMSQLDRLRNHVVEGAANFFDVGGHNASPKPPSWAKSSATGTPSGTQAPTTFHIAPLSDSISLVVIVKGEEEHRWHRRRTPLTNDEIRGFLNDMASKLRVSEQFSPKSIPQKSQVQLKLHVSPSSAQSGIAARRPSARWTDQSIDTFLKSVKHEFGLRPTKEGGTLLNHNSPSRRHFSPGQAVARRPSTRLAVSPEDAAAMFFLGPELVATMV